MTGQKHEGDDPHRAVPPKRKDQPQEEHVEDLLDEALKESFPASDPPSIPTPD